VEWALETVPDALVDGRRPVLLDVAFRREAVRGDVVVARTAPPPGEPGRLVHTLVRAGDGEELARAVTVHSAA
jgi:hypothetical protein